jgi:hypothetical protein
VGGDRVTGALYAIEIVAGFVIGFALAVWCSMSRNPFRAHLVSACVFAAVAGFLMVEGSLFGSLTNGACAAWCAYHAWRNRPRRKPRPARAAGVVRDLGHRLIVAPTEPAGSPP